MSYAPVDPPAPIVPDIGSVASRARPIIDRILHSQIVVDTENRVKLMFAFVDRNHRSAIHVVSTISDTFGNGLRTFRMGVASTDPALAFLVPMWDVIAKENESGVIALVSHWL